MLNIGPRPSDISDILPSMLYILHTHTYVYIYYISYYNKRNAHFDVQELLFQFWTEHRET